MTNHIVTVKDIIDFLSKYPLDMEVLLDRDGWQFTVRINGEEVSLSTEEAISRVIEYSPFDDLLIINN